MLEGYYSCYTNRGPAPVYTLKSLGQFQLKLVNIIVECPLWKYFCTKSDGL